MIKNTQNDSLSEFEVNLQKLLGSVTVNAWRLFLRTPYTQATTPMIRGVWGRALRHVNRYLYDQVFVGQNQYGQNLPRYILRPAPPDPHTAPAIDWILFNVDQDFEKTLWRVWDMACVMGLGSQRHPFQIYRCESLTPDNSTKTKQWNSWTLIDVQCPFPGLSSSLPCVLRFDVPLRLVKKRQLMRSPEFEDLIIASLRRIATLSGMPRSPEYAHLIRAGRSSANQIHTLPWIGEKCNLVRWSAAQQKEVELFGITGSISLPNGVGIFWPLLAATQWCHLGKGTVFGMGQLQISCELS